MEEKNEDSVSRWVCLSINERYNSYIYHSQVKKSIEKTFNGNAEEILFVGNLLEDGMIENALDTYVFVKCFNIYDYISRLEKSRYIKTVLNSYHNVVFISELEIKELKRDWEDKKKNSDSVFFYGDIVHVKKGVYEKLNGIIIDKYSDDEMAVLFKFHVGYRIANLHNDNLTVNGNIFKTIKVPRKNG